jgi:hypothetical protein
MQKQQRQHKQIINIPFAPAGFCTVLVRNDPFLNGTKEHHEHAPHEQAQEHEYPDVLIVPSLEPGTEDILVHTSCSIFMSSATQFNIVMNYKYGLDTTSAVAVAVASSAARVVVNGTPAEVRFLFDHVGTDTDAPALKTCLSVIHEITRPNGKYSKVLDTIMKKLNWSRFVARAEKTFIKEMKKNVFPPLYQRALESVFAYKE